MVDNQLELRGNTTDDEFWRRYSGIREMLVHMEERAELLRRIRGENVIPEQARDLAIGALLTELQDNKKIFFDYLLNFISASMQVLHGADIEMEFTIIEGGRIEMDNTRLLVEGESLEIPIEIGARFTSIILDNAGPKKFEAILSFFRDEELRYDKLFDGIVNRCSLQIMEELYPRRCGHIRLKLPAQSLIEYRVTL